MPRPDARRTRTAAAPASRSERTASAVQELVLTDVLLNCSANAKFYATKRGADNAVERLRAQHGAKYVSEALQLEEGESLWGIVVWTPQVT